MPEKSPYNDASPEPGFPDTVNLRLMDSDEPDDLFDRLAVADIELNEETQAQLTVAGG